MEKPKVKIGDKIIIPLKNYRQVVKITGVVKEIRSSYGNEEYLLTNTTTSEFWTRKTNVNK
jgi:multidrug resistance efflux pump